MKKSELKQIVREELLKEISDPSLIVAKFIFGIFVYFRNNDENTGDNEYFMNKNEAIKTAKEKEYNKSKYHVEVWPKPKSGSSIWDNY